MLHTRSRRVDPKDPHPRKHRDSPLSVKAQSHSEWSDWGHGIGSYTPDMKHNSSSAVEKVRNYLDPGSCRLESILKNYF